MRNALATLYKGQSANGLRERPTKLELRGSCSGTEAHSYAQCLSASPLPQDRERLVDKKQTAGPQDRNRQLGR